MFHVWYNFPLVTLFLLWGVTPVTGEGGGAWPNLIAWKPAKLGHLDKKKWHWDTWTKMIKNCLNIPFGGSLFSRNRLFSEKKRINGNTGGTGLKKEIFLQIYKKIYFFDVDRWTRVEKLVWLIKFSLRVDGTEALSRKDLGFEPWDLGFVAGSKNGQKIDIGALGQKLVKNV